MTRIIYKNRWGVECEVDASEIVSVEGEGSSPASSDAEVYAPLPCRPEGPFSAGWRPIDSAPRDGTSILAFCVHPNARYAGEDFAAWTEIVTTRWIDHNGGGWTWNGLCGEHTHWMPLPPCPAESGGSGGEAVGPSPGPVTPSELTEIARLSEQVKALEGERDHIVADAGAMLDHYGAPTHAGDLQLCLAERIEQMMCVGDRATSKAEAQMKGMREALKPFADAWERLKDPLPQAPFSVGVDANDCARAFRAIQPQEGKDA